MSIASIPSADRGLLESARSRKLLERAKRVIPGGVSSNVRAKACPFPLFYQRAQGSHIWDVDGNEYIDYVLGQGPMLLGYTPEPVIRAMHEQAREGLVYAGQTELEVRAAEMICEMVPCAEMVRFGSTGSEAVHAALRLARSVTGRRRILRFEGHYHGWLDNIAWNHAAIGIDPGPPAELALRPSSKGQSPEDGANLLVLPWNDMELVQRVFRKHGSDIAAVITEPIMYNWCAIPPREGFLQGLRDMCDRYGSLLILDEVITGFRVDLHGAQGLFGVTPDLATFGKALGGGAVVSVLAGRAAYMRLFDDQETVHAGTYNSNPVSMAGTLATLRLLRKDGGAELRKAHAASRALMDGIAAMADRLHVPLAVRGLPPAFHVSFLRDGTQPVVDYRTSFHTDFERTRRLNLALHHRGIRVTERGVWFVSTAHTTDDVDRTLGAVASVLKEV